MNLRFLSVPRWLRRATVVLLQADRPAPLRTDAEVAAEVERNYRWNFTVNLLDGATFWFGATFISSSTITPLFISKLTDSPLPIGLVAAIAQSAWFLPQLFTANAVERLPRKKAVAVNLGFFLERLPLWLLVVSALLAATSPLLALLLFFVGYTWHGLGAGIIATAWQDLIARCFPVARRGRFLA
jgi:MFS family permease